MKNEGALQRYAEQTYRCYGILDEQLKKSGGTTILGGDNVTTVDLHFEPWIREYPFSGLSLKEYPYVEKWLKRMGEIQEVQDAYQKVTGKNPEEVIDGALKMTPKNL